MTSVLLTGAAGYIGSVTARLLLSRGHRVVALDLLRYGGEALIALLDEPDFAFVRVDIRDSRRVASAMEGVDAVVHLAAVVGDPACARDPDEARSVNLDGATALYALSVERRVPRFVFASTCSNYGKMQGVDYVDETSSLRPVSLYAETKVTVEEHLLAQPADIACRPTILRFATAYGLSPRMRFDLTVNEFTRELALGRSLQVYGPRFWRPYCHVADLALAIVTAVEAPPDRVASQVFNVGHSQENYTKQMLVDIMTREIPRSTVEFVQRDEDPRDYRVNFDRIRDRMGFVPGRRVVDGVREIRSALSEGVFLHPDSDRFTNTP